MRTHLRLNVLLVMALVLATVVPLPALAAVECTTLTLLTPAEVGSPVDDTYRNGTYLVLDVSTADDAGEEAYIVFSDNQSSHPNNFASAVVDGVVVFSDFQYEPGGGESLASPTFTLGDDLQLILDVGRNSSIGSTIDLCIIVEDEPASLGDRVWQDDDANGIQDEGEAGVPGVTVNLWTDDDGDGAPDTQIATTTTDASGNYLFDELDPALDYVVQFVAPDSETVFTTQDAGGDDTVDSDAGIDGITDVVELDPGEFDPTIDAGILPPPEVELASLGDRVWLDQDADGIQDEGEPGVPGVTVNLWTDDDADGAPDTQIATTTTDASGNYLFDELDPALDYVVQFVAPDSETVFTTQDAGGDDAVDSDANTGGVTGVIELDPGEFDPTVDAGILPPPEVELAGLGDVVWFDDDGDGVQDEGETGVPDITVNLWTDDDGDGAPDTQIATTTTDANGGYQFVELDPALDYVVQFIAPNLTTQDAGGDDALDSDADPASGITAVVELDPGQFDPTIDAGIFIHVDPLPAGLGDFVWLDVDRDGIQDEDEAGVPDVTVNLWTDDDDDGTPDTQIATTTTDADGSYVFDDLDPAFDYVVQFVAPDSETVFTMQDVGGDDAVDSDAGMGGITGVIELDPGEFDPTVDAGITPPVIDDFPGLGDYVWLDLDRDGVQDAGEPGVPDVTVNLWTDDDADGTPDTQVATTTTDADGKYLYFPLSAGVDYVVQFVAPDSETVFTMQDAGGDDSLDSDANMDGLTGVIQLEGIEIDLTIDAGILPPPPAELAALGDRVWEDRDQDGEQDAGEPGVPGVTVNLWTDDDADGDPDTQIDTTTTDADGNYLFDDLDPDLDYVVEFVRPSGFLFTEQNAAGDAVDSDVPAGSDASGITAVVELDPGEFDPTIDAGIYEVVTGAGVGTPIAMAVAMIAVGGALLGTTRRRPGDLLAP